MDRTKVATFEEIPAGAGMRVDIGEERIALFKIEDTVYAIGDRCSHAEASLAEGEVFDLASGEPGSFPATRPVPVYAVEIVDGDVFLSREEATV